MGNTTACLSSSLFLASETTSYSSLSCLPCFGVFVIFDVIVLCATPAPVDVTFNQFQNCDKVSLSFFLLKNFCHAFEYSLESGQPFGLLAF